MKKNLNPLYVLQESVDVTVYKRKLQKKMILEILVKYPNSASFKKALLEKGYNIMAAQIDDNWSKNEYIQYLKNNIIKYSPVKKNVIGILAGIGITTATALLTAGAVGYFNGAVGTDFPRIDRQDDDGWHRMDGVGGGTLGVGAAGGAWLSKKFRKHLDDRDPDELG